MKNFRIYLLILLSLFTVVSHAVSAGRPKAKRVVLIALDGISVNGFKTARTPCLDELLSQGALSLETRVVMPSVTLPNWTSHLTGRVRNSTEWPIMTGRSIKGSCLR